MTWLLCLIAFAGEIKLDPEIISVAHLIFVDQRIFILDSQQKDIVSVDLNGNMIGRYGKKGLGPGELTHPNLYLIDGDRLLVVGRQQRKLVVMDLNFQYQKQFFLPAGGAIVSLGCMGENYFLYYYDPAREKLVHRFDAGMQRVHSFAEHDIPKRGEGVANMQWRFSKANGSIFVTRDHIFVAHYYQFTINRYDHSGKLQQRFPFPGVNQKNAFEKGKGFVASLKAMEVDEHGRLYVALIAQPSTGLKMAYYRLDPTTGTWEQGMGDPRSLFPRPGDRFVRAVRDEATDRMSLIYVDYKFKVLEMD